VTYGTCQGCGTTCSANDPDLITGHVRDCVYADGADDPVELTIKFSAINWYITTIRADRLAAAAAARPFADLRGPVGDDDEADLAEFLAELAEEAGPAMADGFRIGDVYPAALDQRPGQAALP
jgi:hypothetical protein